MITCLHCKQPLSSLEDQCPHCQHPLDALFQCTAPTCQHIQPPNSHCKLCKKILTGPLSGKCLKQDDQIYFVREWLGGGGMGEVYRVLAQLDNTQPPQELAIKLNKEITDPILRDRFHREVQILSRLNHPHSVRVYGYGEHKENNILIAQFMIVELLKGNTLQEILHDQTLPLSHTLTIFRQITQALLEAHEIGVIHRDLKPDNVMLTYDDNGQPFAKLFDFGLSKDTSHSTPHISTSGVILGTLCYMSPEQAWGKALDQRSDIFSLGIILYQMLSNTLPFDADNLYHLYSLHAEPLKLIPIPLPPTLRALLRCCLAYQPDDRFSDLSECLTQLNHIDLDPLTFTIPEEAPQETPLLAWYPTDQHRSPNTDQPPVYLSNSLLYPLLLVILFSSAIAIFYFFRSQDSIESDLTQPDITLPRRVIKKIIRKIPPTQHKKPHPVKTATQPVSPRTVLPSKPIPRRSFHKIRKQKHSNRAPKRTIIRTYKAITVRFELTPPCPTLSLDKEGSETFDSSSSRTLKPGRYTAHCLSKEAKLRRSFRFRVHPHRAKQLIQQRWKRYPIELSLRPWAYTSIDGFAFPNCQHGCRIRLWSGQNTLTLKRQQQGRKKIVFQKTFDIEKLLRTCNETKTSSTRKKLSCIKKNGRNVLLICWKTGCLL